MQKRWRLKVIPRRLEHKQTNWTFVLEIKGFTFSPTQGSLPLHHTVLHRTLPIFRSTNKFGLDISVLIQCSYSALAVLIQFGRFISLFRVLVHADCKIFSLRTAEPYPFTKNRHPFDSRSCYPTVNGLYVHKPLCLSLQTDTYRSHRIAKIVVEDNNIRQVIIQYNFLAIIFHD